MCSKQKKHNILSEVSRISLELVEIRRIAMEKKAENDLKEQEYHKLTAEKETVETIEPLQP